MGIKELKFGRTVPGLPWLPDNASLYSAVLSEQPEHGYFTVNDDRFVFLLIENRGNYQQYLIGAAPEGDEVEALLDSSPDAIDEVKAHLFSIDRQQVFIHDTSVTSTFVHGTRYCKPCIICSKQLETVDHTSDFIVEQPNGGTNFTASGHYGSTAFDPMSREHLSINICDECLTSKGGEGFVTHVKERQRVIDESVRTDWNSARQ
jgi:hypothetical protein